MRECRGQAGSVVVMLRVIGRSGGDRWPRRDSTERRDISCASVSPWIDATVQIAVLRATLHGVLFSDALAIAPLVVEIVAVTDAEGSDPIERTVP